MLRECGRLEAELYPGIFQFLFKPRAIEQAIRGALYTLLTCASLIGYYHFGIRSLRVPASLVPRNNVYTLSKAWL